MGPSPLDREQRSCPTATRGASSRVMRPLLLLLLLGGCAHAPVAPPPSSPVVAPSPAPRTSACALPPLSELSSAALIERDGTQLDRYQLEGGVWLERAPVLVNQDFDFGTAMGLGGMGAGIAAGKRKQANEANAAALQGLKLGAENAARLDALRAQGTHVFFVLWGAEEALLRMVVEDACAKDAKKAQVVEGAPKASDAWRAPGALDAEMGARLDGYLAR